MARIREHLRESLRAMREVYANRSLRRLQFAWAGSIIGTWAFSIALAVYAYDQGGAAAGGPVGLIPWLPAALAAPFTRVLRGRHPRVPAMVAPPPPPAPGFGAITPF